MLKKKKKSQNSALELQRSEVFELGIERSLTNTNYAVLRS